MEYRVPILPYLKKFILGQLYDGQDEPIKVEEDSPLGRSVMSILIDKRQVASSVARSFHGREYDDALRIVLSHSMMDRSPSIKKLARLNLEFDSLFRTALFVWVKAQNQNGIPAYTAVQAFLDEYDITEEEYAHAAAYGAWKRFKSGEYVKKRRRGVTK